MNSEFKQRILNEYKLNLNWQLIVDILEINDNKNVAKLPFYREKNDLIFRSDQNIKNHDYQSHRLCIFHSIIKNILNVIHKKIHSEFARCYDIISFIYYIRDLTKYLCDYFKYYSKCQIFQTRKHKSYNFLQSIFTSSISFYIIIINFVLTLFLTTKSWNCLMLIICKFIKRILLIFDKTIWIAIDWDYALLNKLKIIDWKLSKVIIFDRDKKFFLKLWTAMFIKFNAKLFYSVAYHFQTDDQNERINQNVEIIFRFLINTLNVLKQWLKALFRFHRNFNNNNNSTFNEIVYNFISMQTFNLMKFFAKNDEFSLKNRRFIARLKIFDVMIFTQMNVKHYYNEKNQLLFIKFENFVYIRLHKRYDISFIAMFNLKFNQQYAKSFKIVKKVKRLIYRLKLFQYWCIHLMLSIIQLKSFSSKIDLFNRFKFNHFLSMFVEEDIDRVKLYTLKKIINKRHIARRESKYLIKWKKYESENDVWKNFPKMKNVMKLIKKYEEMIKNIIYLFKKMKFSSFIAIVFRRKPLIVNFKFMKLFKFSISSIEIIYRKFLMIISIKQKFASIQFSSTIQLFESKIFALSLSTFLFSLKIFASFRRLFQLLLSFF